ncbi:MAG: PEP-CTERM sorting domain-containing protein, partial [Thermoguttaceae bacterium]|nr:PEP-CTERM sorting domain-containing protein [Thermoguttaceae bacterium]
VTLTGGNVIKTGTGKLKIKAAGTQFNASQFTVEAGELDFYGDYNGDMEIQEGATLSPGNSVGNMIVVGNVVIDSGASALFEFGAYNPNEDFQEYDKLTVVDNGSFVLADGSVINLSFEGDPALWAEEGATYQLVFDNDFVNESALLNGFLGNYQDLFTLQGTPEGLFLVGLGAGPIPPGPGPEPGTGVPEPSTWALLLFGTAGLFWLRRKNSLQKNS